MSWVISEVDDSLEKVRQGKIVLASGFLQRMNRYDKVVDLTCQAIAECSTPEQAQRVREEGFEKMHYILQAEQIRDVNAMLMDRVRDVLARLVYDFVVDVLHYDKDFYIDNKPIVRFFTPHDYFIQHKCLDCQGFLKIQGPHHDTWFGHATEGLNVWMAVGKVSHGNGLSIYPDVWGRYIDHDGKCRMPRDQKLGEPLNFELQRGDLLFFPGEHMHSSEINITDDTRYVLTCRFSLNPPIIKHGTSAPWFKSSEIKELNAS